jgi:hypothetical protein
MKVCIWETGHPISQTICRKLADVCGFDLYNVDKHCPNLHRYDACLAYGILRGTELIKEHPRYFFIDKGFWDAEHFTGQYRIGFGNTQPTYSLDTAQTLPQADHGQILEPWRNQGYTLICPPTGHVCEFFGVNEWEWTHDARVLEEFNGREYWIREKGHPSAIDWDKVGKLVTFNSSLGFEALRRGIPVVSDPIHSTIGSYQKNAIDPMNRDDLFSFGANHQFKLGDREKIWGLITHYVSGSGTTTAKPSQPTSVNTRFAAGQIPL